MQTKRYHNSKRKESNDGDHDILGIILIIISAFILLCIIIRPILGIISKGIAAVTLGVFGLFAYPLFLCTLLLGIALIQHRQVSLARCYRVGIVLMTVSLMFILQLATTHNLLSGSFSAYINGTYHGITAGGLLFGMIAYGIQKAVTIPVAYILFSLAFVCSLAFCVALPLYRSRRVQPADDMPAPSPFVKGRGTSTPTRPMSDTSLFVDTIIRHTSDPYIDKGENAEPILPKPSSAPEITDENEKAKREKAYKELFGGVSSVYLPPLSGDSSSSSSSSASIGSSSVGSGSGLGGYVPPSMPTVSAPQAEEKPAKRVHASTAPIVPQVPDKDISGSIIGGEIINGSDYSRQLEEANAQIQREAEKSAPQAGAFTTKKLDVTPAKPIEQPAERPAIINGDYFGGPPKKAPTIIPPSYTATPIPSAAPVSPAKPVAEVAPAEKPVERFSAPAYEQTHVDDFLREVETEEQEPQPPIIAASEYERELTAEERFQQLINETKEQRAAQYEAEQELDDEEFDYDLPDPIADEDMGLLDEQPQAPQKPESAFRIEENAIDLSERSHFEGVDSTGYYETTSMPTRSEPQPQSQIRANEQLKIDDIIAPIPAAKVKKRKKAKYNNPSPDMLTSADNTSHEAFNVACEEKARLLEETLQGLKLPVKVGAITRGPAVTRYELEMPPGIPIKRIEQYSTDIEYYLESNGKIRIEAPIPGKRAVGIEVPNGSVDIVRLRDIIESKEFQNSSSPLTLVIGKDIAGTNIICNLEKMPHLLIAGATNSGKSACLNSIIMSLLYKSSPDDVRIILIDPKRVEFNMYQGIPHLLSEDIINDAQQAINALTWAKDEMDRRYVLMSTHKVRNLAEFNKCDAVKSGEESKLPYIVLIVDELAELMLDSNKKELENKIVSMSQKARAAGIHLILATQRPSVDVITGIIKANLPSRIAFFVKSIVDSRTILDSSGAETLLGRGDMLYAPAGMEDPKRVQGAFVTEQEITAVTAYIRENNEADFDEEFTAAISKREEEHETSSDEDDNKEFDDLMPEILKCVIESGSVSISMIQRRFSVGYARAARIVDQMEAKKFVGPNDGNNKPRAVYITREQYRELFGSDV